ARCQAADIACQSARRGGRTSRPASGLPAAPFLLPGEVMHDGEYTDGERRVLEQVAQLARALRADRDRLTRRLAEVGAELNVLAWTLDGQPALVPRRAQVDPAARVHGGEAPLRGTPVELVVWHSFGRWLDAEPDQPERRHAASYARDGFQTVGDALPGVLVVEHQHARPRGDGGRRRMEELGIHR